MDTMDPRQTLESPLHLQGNPHAELVAKSIDELEEHARYSVIYELARIEAVLRHMFVNDTPLQPIIANTRCS